MVDYSDDGSLPIYKFIATNSNISDQFKYAELNFGKKEQSQMFSIARNYWGEGLGRPQFNILVTSKVFLPTRLELNLYIDVSQNDVFDYYNSGSVNENIKRKAKKLSNIYGSTTYNNYLSDYMGFYVETDSGNYYSIDYITENGSSKTLNTRNYFEVNTYFPLFVALYPNATVDENFRLS